MLIRYRRSEDGKPVARAVVYTEAEHRIDRSGIDPDARRIVERLRENGHEAYIVGGAVRDLLLGRRPKDFDIVTDAEPGRIKRVFRNARIIGRRFRLVHVYAGPKIFEVSTFRSIANGTVGNEYGTIDEDARRRDFTMNALYYDPIDRTLVDYVGGFKDVEAKRVKPVIPLKSIFKEDPVRMIRCVKYATSSGFRIPFLTRLAIKRDAPLLEEASTSRLTEEFVKILGSGKAAPVMRTLADFRLLGAMLPAAAKRLESDRAFRAAFFSELEAMDLVTADPLKEKRLSVLLGFFLKPFLADLPEGIAEKPEAYHEAFAVAREALAPLNPPRVELEAALLVIAKKLGISPLQRPYRSGPERGGRGRGRGRSGEEASGGREVRAEEGRRRPRDADKRDAALEGAAEREAPTGLGGAAEGEEGAAPARKRRRRRKPSSAQAGSPGEGGGDASPAPSPAEGSGSEGAEGAAPARRRRRRRRKPSGGSGSAGSSGSDE